MKIYTKQGDKGETSLFGGKRVLKSSPRIEVYGTVDELNSTLGVAIAAGPSPRGLEILQELQNQLFFLGADLATPPDSKQQVARIEESHSHKLESWIDELDALNPPLRHFILPGGTAAAATLHLARTICRRAERAAIECQNLDPVNTMAIVYLNRLSDLLFVMARYENTAANHSETQWNP
jgi:cob(I)alamin adenosyltransferase